MPAESAGWQGAYWSAKLVSLVLTNFVSAL